MNKLKLEALATSILLYLIIIVSIIAMALYTPTEHKAKHYVVKNSNVIEVSLGSPLQNKKSGIAKKQHNKSKTKSKKKIVKKPKEVRKKRPKKVRNFKKSVAKQVAKKYTHKTSKSSETKATKHSRPKINTHNLFKNISKDNFQSNTHSGNSGKSLRKVNKDRGIVNRYFANIQNKLRGWPAQSNFAGERVSVELKVYSSGLFEYKILHRSINPEFNRSLKSYLEQLKRIGFGPHSNPTPYKIVVDFIAK